MIGEDMGTIGENEEAEVEEEVNTSEARIRSLATPTTGTLGSGATALTTTHNGLADNSNRSNTIKKSRCRIHNTSFSSELTNGPNNIEYYITEGRKGLSETNTLAYWAYL